MTPFEDLIHELGKVIDITLHPDSHQSCLLAFPADQISIQIDLHTSGDKILVGTQLGALTRDAFRERIFMQAMRVNGASITPRGILAFSEKNDTLVLFQYLSLSSLNGEKLHKFVQLFREHAKVWKEAIKHGDIPTIEEDDSSPGERMFGLNP